jgi:hypothetical protein
MTSAVAPGTRADRAASSARVSREQAVLLALFFAGGIVGLLAPLLLSLTIYPLFLVGIVVATWARERRATAVGFALVSLTWLTLVSWILQAVSAIAGREVLLVLDPLALTGYLAGFAGGAVILYLGRRRTAAPGD